MPLTRKRIIYDRGGHSPYMIRHHLLFREKSDHLERNVKVPFNVYLHKILLSDEPILHDHPWNYATLILKGGYWQHTPEGKHWCGPGHFRYCKASDLHRLELSKIDNKEIPCWSLFFMGVKKQEWGFIKNGKWIHNETYLKEKYS